MNERASFLQDSAGRTVTVYIRGEIDHHTAVTVRNGIDAMLFEKRPAKLILDLSKVSFMDSSGLGLIMGRLSVIKSLGGTMSVQNPSRETQAILTLAGMERLISIEYTEGGYEKPTESSEKSSKKPYEPPKIGEVSPARIGKSREDVPKRRGGQARSSKSTRRSKGVKAPDSSA